MIEQATEPIWADRARELLEGLVDLPRGWDGYDAEPLSRAAAQSALSFLETYVIDSVELPEMTPIHDGIQLEWHSAVADVEIELRPSADTAFVREGNREWEGDVRENRVRLAEILERMPHPQGA